MANGKKTETDKGKSKPGLVGTHGYRKPEEIKTHPELKELYLRISKDEERLSEGIDSGFLEDRPVTLVKGPWVDGEVVADGHTRIDLAFRKGVKEVPVVVHETETLLDAIALVFGIDFRQRKRHEVIHLIHVVEKFQSIADSISDAGKKPKGKTAGLLARWIGVSQPSVERMKSILKNPEAKAYVEKHKNQKLSLLGIYDMFKDKAEGCDGPSAPKGKGEQTPPVPPAPPAGEGEGRKTCFGTHPAGIDKDCLVCPDEGECEAATAQAAGQSGEPTGPPIDFPDAVRLEILPMDSDGCSGLGNHSILNPNVTGAKCDCPNNEVCKTISQAWAAAEEEADNPPQSPEEQPEKKQATPLDQATPSQPEQLDCYGDYMPFFDDDCPVVNCTGKLGCINQTHENILNGKAQCKSEIADAEARGDSEKVKELQGYLEDYDKDIEEITAIKAEIEKAALAAVDALDEAAVVDPTPPPVEVVSPEGSEKAAPDKDVQPDPDMKMVPLQLAELLERLPEWLLKFLNENPEEIKSARWIAIGEGSVPEIGDNAMLMTNPDNPPLSKAEEKKAAKKGLSKQEIKKIGNKKASKAAADAVHKATSKGKKAAKAATA